MVDTSQFDGQIDEEFLGEARDTLSGFSILVNNMRSGAQDMEDGLAIMARECSHLRQLAHWANQPLIDLTVRRMESYVEAMTDLMPSHLSDMEVFVFVLESILEGEIDTKTDEGEFVRSLPVPRPADLSDLEHLDIEILLVEPQDISARIFERELQSGGYRVIRTNRSFEALELGVRTKPDMFICAQVLDELSGVDLCRALGAIERTENIPFALLTSYTSGHPALEGLPKSAAIIQKSGNFGDDLASAFQRFRIT